MKAPADGAFEVEIVLVDGSIFPHKGHITFQQPDYDTKTGTFLVRASVDNPQGALRPNQYVRARVMGIRRPNAVLVPQRAVQQGAKGHFVWVVDKDNKAESRPVTVGQWHGDDWFIDEGLTSGERVVVDGAVTLAPGAPVQVTQTLSVSQPEAVAGAPK